MRIPSGPSALVEFPIPVSAVDFAPSVVQTNTKEYQASNEYVRGRNRKWTCALGQTSGRLGFWLDSNRLIGLSFLKIVRVFVLVRGYVVKGSVEPDGAELGDPGQRCEFAVIDGLP